MLFAENGPVRSSAEIQTESLRNRYRKQRTVFEPCQLKALEDTFSENPYPSSEKYEMLSDEICVDEARLKIWFQNRRARYRRSAKRTPSPTDSKAYSGTLPAIAVAFQSSASPKLSYPSNMSKQFVPTRFANFSPSSLMVHYASSHPLLLRSNPCM